jgi:hypothetical protein
MFVGFALFESLDGDGRVESYLVFPTDTPRTVVVDRLEDVRGARNSREVDLGGLRFYADEKGLKIRRIVADYGPQTFRRFEDQIDLKIEHTALPIPSGTMGYYTLLMPMGFYGHIFASCNASLRWLADTRRLMVSIKLLDHNGYLVNSVSVRAELRKDMEPPSNIVRIKSSEVYVDWNSGGPPHNDVRAFLRAANASLSDCASGVFICHSHADKPFARKLAVALAGNGFRVWIDEAEIRVGESLIGKIESGISGVTHLLVLLSKASVQSAWCREELRMALSRQIGGKGIRVLPLLLEDCDLPGFLQEKKYADLRDPKQFEASLREITASLVD